MYTNICNLIPNNNDELSIYLLFTIIINLLNQLHVISGEYNL